MATIDPRSTVLIVHAGIQPVLARVLLAGPVPTAHTVNTLTVVAMILVIAFLVTVGRVYRQMVGLVAQLLQLAAAVGFSVLLLSLGVLVLVLVVLHA